MIFNNKYFTKFFGAVIITGFVIFLGSPQVLATANVNWTPLGQINGANHNWVSIASSSDGSTLIASDDSQDSSGSLYISHNSGATWSGPIDPGNGFYGYGTWSSVSSDSSGTVLTAASTNGNGSFISTDSGETWNPTCDEAYDALYGIASDSTGQKLFGTADRNYGQCANPGNCVWISTNGGTSWTESSGYHSACNTSDFPYAISSDTTGTNIIVAYSNNQVCVSKNSGSTWTLSSVYTPNSQSTYVSFVSANSNGFLATAGGSDSTHGVYASSDGVTWTKKSSMEAFQGSSSVLISYNIASDSTGQNLIFAATDGVYNSADSGATWTKTLSGQFTVASDYTGAHFVAAKNTQGGIYVGAPATGIPANVSLSALSISQGSLSPSFDSSVISYNVNLPNGTSSVTVTPTATTVGSTVKVNNVSVTSGSPSGPISLVVGDNTIAIVVTAANQSTQQYTITVNVAGSSDATLSSLVVSQGSLSPTFSSGTTSYRDDVSNDITTITVTPTLNQANATMTIYDHNNSPVAILSGATSSPISLNVLGNSINIMVTAQDGVTTKNYGINVYRAGRTTAQIASFGYYFDNTSTGAHIITSANGTIDNTNHTVSFALPYGLNLASFAPTITLSSGATISPNTNEARNFTTPQIYTVTAEDRVTTQQYTVTVTKASREYTYADTLLVINDNSVLSQEVGNYFINHRQGLGLNVLHLTGASLPSDPVPDNITLANYTSLIKTPIANYIATLTSQNGGVNPINYIILTKGIPIRIPDSGAGASISNSVDSTLAACSSSSCSQVNPFYNSSVGFSSQYYSVKLGAQIYNYPMYLVTRLDGYVKTNDGCTVNNTTCFANGNDISQITAIVDHSTMASIATVATLKSQGLFVLDGGSSLGAAYDNTENPMLQSANTILTNRGWTTNLDLTSTFLGNQQNVLGYFSWGIHSADPKPAHAIPNNTYENGAIGETIVSYSANSFAYPPVYDPNSASLISDLTQEGISGVKGYVYEPFANNVARPQILFDRYTNGFNMAESYYAASLSINWKDIVIGDPKMTITNTANTMSSFNFSSPATTGIINSTNHTVALSVPYGTSITSIAPTIIVSPGATVSPASGAARNFTTPQTYTVTAQDGTTTQSYVVTVTVGTSNDATLSNLTISSGTFSPTFASGTTSYTASVDYSTDSLTVTPTVNQANATVKVNNVTVSSGSASDPITLLVGQNAISVEVTAQDGSTKITYIITVTRAASNDATLSNLTISTGTLSPIFSSGTTSYTASVDYNTSSLTLTPTQSHAYASIKVNGTTVASGAASDPITLLVGQNAISVEVTAQDGTTKTTYAITVTRAPGGGRVVTIITYATANIQASADTGGTISPNGSVSLAYGNNKTYLITPELGYQIKDVLVDGVSKGAISTYTFSNINSYHTILATFSPILTPPTNTNAQTIESLKTQIQQLQNLIQQILAQKNTLTLQLTKDLKFGDRDNEVILLQNILKKLKFLSPSVPIVNNFGVSTLRAVQAFQAKYNILNSRSPQYGIVGPNTRNRLNNLNK